MVSLTRAAIAAENVIMASSLRTVLAVEHEALIALDLQAVEDAMAANISAGETAAEIRLANRAF